MNTFPIEFGTHIIEIVFSEVAPGERFMSRWTKRGLIGIKTLPFIVRGRGESFEANAIILTNLYGGRETDSGTFIRFELDQMVEVDRPDKK